MKNIMIKISLIAICMVSLNLQAQVSPVNKEMADKLEQQKRDYKQKQIAQNIDEGKSEKQKSSYNYIELEVYTIEDKYFASEQKIDYKKFAEDKASSTKAEFLMKLPSLLEKGKLNIVNELGNQGIKIISHSFIETKKGEKHIYILEL